MQGLVKAGKIKLWLGIIMTALGVLSLVGIALFSLKLLYAPLIICIVIAATATYAAPLLFISRWDGRLYMKIIENTEEGSLSIDELSAAVGIKPEPLRKIIAKGIKRGYLRTDTVA